nr:hypothetical protein [Microbacterium sp.]
MVLRLGVDEAVLASDFVTAAAVEHAACEVIVDAVALSPLHTGINHHLHAFEELRGDQRFVASGIDVAFEGHHAEVVRVAQDLTQLAARQGALRPLRRLACGEPLLGEHLGELDHAVLTRRVLLEGPGDERGALRVDGDGVDEPSVEVFAVVDVAELGASGGAAALGLVEELLLDVFAGLAHLHLVEDVDHGFHGVTHVALSEVLFGGNELDAHGRENALGEGGIGEVAERPRAHVDHDVGDLWVFLDVAQH